MTTDHTATLRSEISDALTAAERGEPLQEHMATIIAAACKRQAGALWKPQAAHIRDEWTALLARAEAQAHRATMAAGGCR